MESRIDRLAVHAQSSKEIKMNISHNKSLKKRHIKMEEDKGEETNISEEAEGESATDKKVSHIQTASSKENKPLQVANVLFSKQNILT